jgi:hypothetical protein
MDLGVTVLSGLGGRHIDDLLAAVSDLVATSFQCPFTHLAWATLDNDVSVLSESRAL